jgi:hypothetical protein
MCSNDNVAGSKLAFYQAGAFMLLCADVPTHTTLWLFVCFAGTVTLAGESGGLKAGFIKQELHTIHVNAELC